MPRKDIETIPREAHAQALSHVDQRLLDGLPEFHPVHTAEDVQHHLAKLVREMFEVGRRLVQANEATRTRGGGGSTGEGFTAFLGAVGISRSSGYRFMGIARRLEEIGANPDGKLLSMSASMPKLAAVLELGDEDLRTLDSGGVIDGLGDADEIDRMRTGEVKQYARRLVSERERAVDVAKKAEDDRDEAVRMRMAAENEFALGRHAPRPIEDEFARIYNHLLKFAHDVKSRSKAERHEAYKGVLALYNRMNQVLDVALIPEQLAGVMDVLPDLSEFTPQGSED